MKTPRIESLSIGMPKRETFRNQEIVTGIRKTPASGPLRLGRLGFEGDGVGDTKHHGGPDKAVCVYCIGHYPYWEMILETTLPMAAFGENLTVAGLLEEDVCIGDIFELGTAVVQVSQPRQPCRTLAARYGRTDMIKLVVDSGRTGFYLRVLKEGMVEKNNLFVLKERDIRGITVAFANQIFHHEKNNYEGVRKVLEVPALSESWRRSFEEFGRKCRGQ